MHFLPMILPAVIPIPHFSVAFSTMLLYYVACSKIHTRITDNECSKILQMMQ